MTSSSNFRIPAGMLTAEIEEASGCLLLFGGPLSVTGTGNLEK
jgi:hypothetical protein